MKFRYSRHSGYECSSKGDYRFSALFARLPEGRTIEEIYQGDVKGFDPGGTRWWLGKGKQPLVWMTRKDLWTAYFSLWEQWAEANPHLMDELRCRVLEHGGVVRDSFATSDINQARALAELLRRDDREPELDPEEYY